MKNNKFNYIVGTTITAVVLAATVAMPVFAQGLSVSANASATVGSNNGSVGVGATAGAGLRATIIARAKDRADQEITRRVNALNALSARINAMVKLSADNKTSLSTAIQGQISTMNDLQTKIDTDAASNTTTTLKADIQSITKAYRIFILIVPQGAIEAAADRVISVNALLTGDVQAKLQAKITADQAAGKDVSAEQTAYTDFTAKTADASAKAQAATTEVANLKPDNGDATVMASNTAALKDAHTKVLAGQQDVLAARADAGVIAKANL